MDELEIQGKKYISSKRAAQLTGYAKDYVGQLARSGKIPGMRMGRAWFVEEAALLGHRSSDTSETAISSPEVSLAVQQEAKPQEVSAFSVKRVLNQNKRITTEHLRSLSPATIKAFGFHSRSLPSTWGTAVYSSEDVALMPPLRKEENDKGNKVLFHAIHGKAIPVSSQSTPNQAPVLTSAKSVTGVQVNEIKRKAIALRKKRSPSRAVLSFGALTAALAILIFFSAGLFVSSNVVFKPQEGVYSANLFVGFQYVHDFLAHYPPFQAGIAGLGGFFKMLSGSFSAFFIQGVGFLAGLLNFAFGK